MSIKNTVRKGLMAFVFGVCFMSMGGGHSSALSMVEVETVVVEEKIKLKQKVVYCGGYDMPSSHKISGQRSRCLA